MSFNQNTKQGNMKFQRAMAILGRVVMRERPSENVVRLSSGACYHQIGPGWADGAEIVVPHFQRRDRRV